MVSSAGNLDLVNLQFHHMQPRSRNCGGICILNKKSLSWLSLYWPNIIFLIFALLLSGYNYFQKNGIIYQLFPIVYQLTDMFLSGLQ